MLAAVFQDIVRAGSERTDCLQVVWHYEHYGIKSSLRSLQASYFFLRHMTPFFFFASYSFKSLILHTPLQTWCPSCKLTWTTKALIFFLNLVPFLHNPTIQPGLTCFYVHNTG